MRQPRGCGLGLACREDDGIAHVPGGRGEKRPASACLTRHRANRRCCPRAEWCREPQSTARGGCCEACSRLCSFSWRAVSAVTMRRPQLQGRAMGPRRHHRQPRPPRTRPRRYRQQAPPWLPPVPPQRSGTAGRRGHVAARTPAPSACRTATARFATAVVAGPISPRAATLLLSPWSSVITRTALAAAWTCRRHLHPPPFHHSGTAELLTPLGAPLRRSSAGSRARQGARADAARRVAQHAATPPSCQTPIAAPRQGQLATAARPTSSLL